MICEEKDAKIEEEIRERDDNELDQPLVAALKVSPRIDTDSKTASGHAAPEQ